MFLKRGEPYALVVGMAGVKMGDRFLQIGCADGGRLAAIAQKVGLSGRALAVAPDEPSAARARKGAANAGVLVDVEVAPPTRLPVEDAAFDLVIVDDTAGLVGKRWPVSYLSTGPGVLSGPLPGGRVMVVQAGPRGGLRGSLFSSHSSPLFPPPC